MRCKNCNSPMNEWNTECKVCKTEVTIICNCHNEPAKGVKGSYLGSSDYVCLISGKYCNVRSI